MNSTTARTSTTLSFDSAQYITSSFRHGCSSTQDFIFSAICLQQTYLKLSSQNFGSYLESYEIHNTSIIYNCKTLNLSTSTHSYLKILLKQTVSLQKPIFILSFPILKNAIFIIFALS